MAKYSVPLNSYANISVDVETDETDPEKIAELAQEKTRVSVCHQCAGSSNNSLEIGDEWSPTLQDGKPEVYKVSE